MTKNSERLQMRRVFGEKADSARDHERPDFLLDTGDGVLGIEVTSLYSSNSDAKLKKLEGYSDDLLDGRTRVHRRDDGRLEVAQLTMLNPDDTVVDTVTGIVQKHPSPVEQVRLLFERIAEKEAKVGEYQRSCLKTDLIVSDESHLFRHESHEEFYKRYQLLVPRRRLLSSVFREIYLVTQVNVQHVYVPLIGNALASDCYGYLHALHAAETDYSPDEALQLLTAALFNDGHTRVAVIRGQEGVGFQSGAWEVFLGDGGIALRNWMVPHRAYGGARIAAVVAEISADLLREARSLTTSKRRSLSMVDMRLPACDSLDEWARLDLASE